MNAMMTYSLKLFCLMVLTLAVASPPASAQAPAREAAAALCSTGGADMPAPVLLAKGWGIGRWFSGSGGRTRVVQFCVVTMCVALFIMMRKLN